MKKILSIILAAVMLIGTMAVPSFAATADLTSSLNGLVNVPVISAIDLTASAEITEADLTVTAGGETVSADEYAYENGVLTFADDMQAKTAYTISAGGTSVSFTTGYALQITDAAEGSWTASGKKELTTFGEGIQGYTASNQFAISLRVERKNGSSKYVRVNMYAKDYSDSNKDWAFIDFDVNSNKTKTKSHIYDMVDGTQKDASGVDKNPFTPADIVDFYFVYDNGIVYSYNKYPADTVWTYRGLRDGNSNGAFKNLIDKIELESLVNGNVVTDFSIYYGTEYIAPEGEEPVIEIDLTSSLDTIVNVPVISAVDLSAEETLIKDYITVTAGDEVVDPAKYDYEDGVLTFADDMQAKTTYTISAGATPVSFTTGYAKQITDATNGAWTTEGTKAITAFGDGKQGYTAGDEFAVSFSVTRKSGNTKYVALYMYDKDYNESTNKSYTYFNFDKNNSNNVKIAPYDYITGSRKDGDGSADAGGSNVAATDNVDFYAIYTQGVIYGWAKASEDSVWTYLGKRDKTGTAYGNDIGSMELKALQGDNVITNFNVYFGDEYVAPEINETLTVASSFAGAVYVPVVNTKIPLTLSLDLSKEIVEDAIIVKANGDVVEEYTIADDFTVEFANNLAPMSTYEITFDTDVLEENNPGTNYETNSINFTTGLPVKDGEFTSTSNYFGFSATVGDTAELGTGKMTKGYVLLNIYDESTEKEKTVAQFAVRKNSSGTSINIWDNTSSKTYDSETLIDDGSHSWDIVIYYIDGTVYAYAKSPSEEQYKYCASVVKDFVEDIYSITGVNVENLAILQPDVLKISGSEVTIKSGSVTSITFNNPLKSYSGNITLTPVNGGNAVVCQAVSAGNKINITLGADLEILTEYTVAFENTLTDIFGGIVETCTIVTPKTENGYTVGAIKLIKEGGKYYATVSAGLANTSAANADVDLYIAVYAQSPDEAVYLKNATTSTVTLTSTMTTIKTDKIEIPAKIGSEKYFIKAFLWNDDLLPICDCTALDAE